MLGHSDKFKARFCIRYTRILSFLILATCLFKSIEFCKAAEFSKIRDTSNYTYEYAVRLDGDIQLGDARKLNRFLDLEFPNRVGFYSTPALIMNSNGGSLFGAVELAEFISSNSMPTYIDEGDVCYSACALVFMHGNVEDEETGNRVLFRSMHPSAKLGFHAPYLMLDTQDGPFSRADVETAYSIALKSLSKILRIAPGTISADLLSNMLAFSPSEMLEVEEVGQAIAWEIEISPAPQKDSIKKIDIAYLCYNYKLVKNILSENFDKGSFGYVYESQDFAKSWADSYIDSMKYFETRPSNYQFVFTVNESIGVDCRVDVDMSIGVPANVAVSYYTYDGKLLSGNHIVDWLWSYPINTKIKEIEKFRR